LDYFEVLVWPVLVLGLIATALVLFRRQIGNLIDRMRTLTVGPGSAQFGTAPQPEPGPSGATGGAPENTADLVREAAEGLEAQYQADIAELSERLAATDFYLYCERVFRTIYGSQIMLLQYLQARGAAGSSTEDLGTFFQQHVDAFRRVNPSYQAKFDAWVGYLTSWQLVAQDPSAPGRYHISPHGVGFLAYLLWAGIPAWKPS